MAFFLLSIANQKWFTTQGVVLAGGSIGTYLAGTTTPAPSYTDPTGAVLNANPVLLGSDGSPNSGSAPVEIWVSGSQAYKIIVKDSNGVTQYTYDNLPGVNDVSTSASEFPFPLPTTGLTYIGATQFSVPGDYSSILTANRRLRASVAAGTVYGVVSTAVFGAGITTVTVVLDSGALDNGLSAVSYSILSADHSSLPQIFVGDIYYPAGVPTLVPSQVRQTVLSGPVDASGFAAFGGSTGAATVTASGTLLLAAANGAFDRIGKITNPSWTGLSTNGTMYLWLDIAADGTCTPGSGVLAPVYQWGGTYSTTNNQFTFNIQEMTAKVGTGAVANQAYRVYVGEVTVAGAVVTVITWYQLQGRFQTTQVVIAATTVYSFTSNMGVSVNKQQLWLICKTAENGYSIGDRLATNYMFDATGRNFILACTRNNATAVSSGGLETVNKGTGAVVSLTFANWSLEIDIERGW